MKDKSLLEEQYAKMFWQYWMERWPSATCNKKTLQLSANFRETKSAFFAGMHAALKVMEIDNECPKCGCKLSFGLSNDKWICTGCGLVSRDYYADTGKEQ